jgi:MFS family permease
MYSFTIATLIGLWGISKAQAGELGTVTLLLSSLGGWISGMLCDRYGRVKILQLTIGFFAFFTFLSGMTQNFWQLFLCRALQGLGFGGEWAAGSVLMGETIRKEYRGRAVGTLQSGWAVGLGLAAIVYMLMFSVFRPALAWRVMFWIGILPAILVFYVRRYVREPEIFQNVKRDKKEKSGIFTIFSMGYLPMVIKASVFMTGSMGGYYAIAVWLPTYFNVSRHLSVANTGIYLFVTAVGSFVGYLTAAHLSDYIGRKPTFFLFTIGAALTMIACMILPVSNNVVLVLTFPLGLFANGMFAPTGPFLSELFPTHVRATAQGFCYNSGRGIGALFPMLVGILSAHLQLGTAIAIFCLSSYTIMLFGWALLPETKGRELTELEKDGARAASV